MIAWREELNGANKRNLASSIFICLFINEVKHMNYLELLQKALAEEIQATRLYLACMALAPQEDIPILLEINTDETDHTALISTLISKYTGQNADYETMVSGVG